jgi:hypothetical protein
VPLKQIHLLLVFAAPDDYESIYDDLIKRILRRAMRELPVEDFVKLS